MLVPAKTSVFPIEAARFIAGNDITIWYSVPSVLSMLALRGGLKGGEFPRLRTMLFAGEVFPTKYLRRLMGLLPHVGFYNLYGPTETNVCAYYQVPPLPEDATEAIPIGKAIGNVEVFAVGEDGEKVARGEVGELYVRGTTVMQGYWDDSERTARGLIPNPFGGQIHDPVYRTGDLVQEAEDGNFRFLGRRDAQIKSAATASTRRARDGPVRPPRRGGVRGARHPRRAGDEPDQGLRRGPRRRRSGSARALLRAADPPLLVPELFEFRAALPKTSTGKVDRQALRAGAEARTAL